MSEPDGLRARDEVTVWVAKHAPDGLVAVTTYRTSQPLEVRFRQTFTRYVGTVTSRASPPANLNEWLREQGWTDRGQ